MGDPDARSTAGPATDALGKLMGRWTSFVCQVEAGFDDSIYDYANDLAVRDALEERIRLLPAAQGDAVRAELYRWDGRFEQATRPAIRPLAPGVADYERPWWFRVPLKLTAEFASDLRCEGLIR